MGTSPACITSGKLDWQCRTTFRVYYCEAFYCSCKHLAGLQNLTRKHVDHAIEGWQIGLLVLQTARAGFELTDCVHGSAMDCNWKCQGFRLHSGVNLRHHDPGRRYHITASQHRCNMSRTLYVTSNTCVSCFTCVRHAVKQAAGMPHED